MALNWETLESKGIILGKKSIKRAKVPGGWLIRAEVDTGGSVIFMPDPHHEWDGHSLDEVKKY